MPVLYLGLLLHSLGPSRGLPPPHTPLSAFEREAFLSASFLKVLASLRPGELRETLNARGAAGPGLGAAWRCSRLVDLAMRNAQCLAFALDFARCLPALGCAPYDSSYSGS